MSVLLVREVIDSVKNRMRYVENILGMKKPRWSIEMVDDEQLFALFIPVTSTQGKILREKEVYKAEDNEEHLYASPSNQVIINIMKNEDTLSLLIYLDDETRESMDEEHYRDFAIDVVNKAIEENALETKLNTEHLYGYGSLYYQ